MMGCIDEIIVTDNGEIVDVDKCNTDDGHNAEVNLDYLEDDEMSFNNVECEVICSSSDPSTDSKLEMYPSTSNIVVNDQLEFECFSERVDDMLSVIFIFLIFFLE